MAKKLCKLLIIIFTFAVICIMCQTAVFAVTPVKNYVKDTDVVVIMPAENYVKNSSQPIPQLLKDGANGWTLSVQNDNCFNGDDLHMWQFGVSTKMRIWDYDKGDEKGYFRFKPVNWREAPSSRFVDVEGQSKKDKANVHVWTFNKKGNVSKWFCFVEDGDGDKETFYIYNRHSGKYLAPENFFDTSGKKYEHYQCLAKSKNTVLSSKPFRWRIEVINSTPDSLKNDRAWMTKMKDTVKLSEINIPGTHDSATANIDGGWNSNYNLVACQKYFIQEQLNIGTRAFDLRLCKDGDKIILIHGGKTFKCRTPDTDNNAEVLQFEYVMEDFKNFLEKNPGETIIAMFRFETGNESELATAYKNVIDKYKNIMYDFSKNTNPTLGDVRGKIVPFSTIKGATGGIYGHNLSGWGYNPKTNKYSQLITGNSYPQVYVQDNYETSNSNKQSYIYETIKNLNGLTKGSSAPSKNSFVFNFISCEQPLINTPFNAAQNNNLYLINNSEISPFFDNKKRVGILMMDYIDEMMCKRVINSNSSAYMKNNTIRLAAESTEDFEEIENNGYTLNIQWPHISELTYGYTLNDAGIYDGAVYVKETDENNNETMQRIDGTFSFTDGLAVPKVTDSEKTLYELQFTPFENKYGTISKQVTLKINRRPIGVSIGNYEIQYGDTPGTWRDIVQVVGRIADSDAEKLCGTNMTITKTENGEEKEYNLLYTGDTKISDVITSGMAVGTKGSIRVGYDGGVGENIEERFPNYEVTFDKNENSTWEIVPREVTIEWSGVRNYLVDEPVDIKAALGNVIEREGVKEDVKVVVEMRIDSENETTEADDNCTRYIAEATLEGADAANYVIPDYMGTVTYTVSNTVKEIRNPQIRLSQNIMEYTGEELRPEVSVFDGDTLIPSDEYNVTYSNNIECGLAIVEISNKEGGRYSIIPENYETSDEIVKNNCTVTFEITKKLFDSESVEVIKNADNSVTIKIIDRKEKEPILYQAFYDENETLTSVLKIVGTIEDDSITYKIDYPESEHYKFMIWDEQMHPIIDAVDENSEWFSK